MKSEEDWKKELTPETYRIMWKKGTEPPFTGKYDHHHEEGTYYCAGCGNPLFESGAKYDSGSGWPSFYQPQSDSGIATDVDQSLGMQRIEVKCSKCGGHLGHVFEDGPDPTGLRYCINSAALDFKKNK